VLGLNEKKKKKKLHIRIRNQQTALIFKKHLFYVYVKMCQVTVEVQ